MSMSKSQKRVGCFVCLDRHMNSNSNREAQRTWSGENENSGCPRRTIVTERSHTFSLKLDEELGMFTFRADARCSPIEFVDDFERFTASPNDFAFKYEGETFDAQRPDSFSPTDSVGEKQTTARRQIESVGENQGGNCGQISIDLFENIALLLMLDGTGEDSALVRAYLTMVKDDIQYRCSTALVGTSTVCNDSESSIPLMF